MSSVKQTPITTESNLSIEGNKSFIRKKELEEWKNTMEKILKGLNALLPSLNGKDRKSCEFRITYLNKLLEGEKQEKYVIFCLEKIDKMSLLDKIYKNNYTINALKNILGMTKDPKIMNLIQLAKSKIVLLKQAHMIKSEEVIKFQKNLHNLPHFFDSPKKKYSGCVNIEILKTLFGPSTEHAILQVTIDSSITIESKIINGQLSSMRLTNSEIKSETEVFLTHKGFLIEFVESKECEIYLRKDDSLLGYYYFPTFHLKTEVEDRTEDKKFSIGLQQIALITFQAEFSATKNIHRTMGMILNIERIGHILHDFTQFSPCKCSICHNIIQGGGYSCLNCNRKVHKSCSNLILFQCKSPNALKPKINKKYTVRYNIEHKFEDKILNKDEKMGFIWCYSCGMPISKNERFCTCKKCKECFHKRCQPFVPNSCGLSFELRKKMCLFLPKSLSHLEDKTISIYDFKPLYIIGKGAFGTIILAQSLSKKKFKDKNVILKILSKKQIRKNNTIEYIYTEESVLRTISNDKSIKSKFFSKMLASFSDMDIYCFVLEFLRGGDLLNFIRTKIISYEQIKIIIAQIFIGLTFLHSKNIIFRDLKLENVLLDEKGDCYLADFGLSKKLENDTTNTYCGTVGTVAPEVISQDDYGLEVDWWSFGCIIYELFEHVPPFPGDTVYETQEMIQTYEIKFEKSNIVVRDLVTKLLEKDKTKRIGINDSDEIKNHEFFTGIDWKKVENKEYKMETLPDIKIENNFEKNFMKLTILKKDLEKSNILDLINEHLSYNF